MLRFLAAPALVLASLVSLARPAPAAPPSGAPGGPPVHGEIGVFRQPAGGGTSDAGYGFALTQSACRESNFDLGSLVFRLPTPPVPTVAQAARQARLVVWLQRDDVACNLRAAHDGIERPRLAEVALPADQALPASLTFPSDALPLSGSSTRLDYAALLYAGGSDACVSEAEQGPATWAVCVARTPDDGGDITAERAAIGRYPFTVAMRPPPGPTFEGLTDGHLRVRGAVRVAVGAATEAGHVELAWVPERVLDANGRDHACDAWTSDGALAGDTGGQILPVAPATSRRSEVRQVSFTVRVPAPEAYILCARHQDVPGNDGPWGEPAVVRPHHATGLLGAAPGDLTTGHCGAAGRGDLLWATVVYAFARWRRRRGNPKPT